MSISRGIDKGDVMRIYNGLLLTYKRKEIGLSVEMWMDLDCHTELSKSEREKQILYINTYMRNLKKMV